MPKFTQEELASMRAECESGEKSRRARRGLMRKYRIRYQGELKRLLGMGEEGKVVRCPDGIWF